MEIDFSHIDELVKRPGESLSVEIKRWISPDQPEGQAMLVKAALALRNHGGGYIVIGFDNNTLEPDKSNVPTDIKALFHGDKIQEVVTKFSSEPFEIAVEFPKRDGQIYPVIVVPTGIKTPVVTKSKLCSGERTLIDTDVVYMRSLNVNNRVSSARATWRDWPKLVEVCFDNREADIGRFLRRHLSKLTPEVVREFVAIISQSGEIEVTTEQRLEKYFQESEDRFQTVVKARNVKPPEIGTWDVALFLLGEIPTHTANAEFLNLLDVNNPDYTGWPVWLNSRNFTNKSARPYVFQGVWETFILNLNKGGVEDLDFMRFDPKGRFYLKRMFQDDISGNSKISAPLTVLDFGLPVIRTAEAIAVGIAFAKAMGCVAEKTQLAFAFKWKKLQGRQLASWANAERYISPGRSAYQDEVSSFVNVPLDTPLSALTSFVSQAIRPLFEIFDGFELSSGVVEDLTRRLIERRL